MRKFFAIVSVLGLVSFQACQGKSDAQSDGTVKGDSLSKDPKTALENANEKWKALNSFSCEMVLKILDGGGGTEPIIGKYYFRKGKYRIELGEDEITCNGDSVITWSPEFGHVEAGPMNPFTDLTLNGIYKLYKTANNIKSDGPDGGFEKYTLIFSGVDDLFPKKEIWLDPETGLVVRYNLFSKEGGNYYYELKAIKLNEITDDKLFTIDWTWVHKAERGEIPPVEHSDHHH